MTTVGRWSAGDDARLLAFDAAGELLTPFRTWRNTNTEGRR
jgi:hypothetical protein